MSSPSLLLGLMVFACLNSFMKAESVTGGHLCCFEFHKKPIPTARIVTVEETRSDCTHSGVILITKKGFRTCADPEVDWVKQIIQSKINQKIMTSSVGLTKGAEVCCFEFYKRLLPLATIVHVEETRSDCTHSGFIFKTKNRFQMCADPEVDWVKKVIDLKRKPSA